MHTRHTLVPDAAIPTLARPRGAFAAMLLAAWVLAGSTAATSAELVSRRLAGLPVASVPNSASWSARRPISADGRFVVFSTYASDVLASPRDTNQDEDVFVRDLQTGTTELVSVNVAGTAFGKRRSTPVAISADGRYVLFDSSADDLVAGDDNDRYDVFVRDLQLGTTELVSAAADGSGPGNDASWAGWMSPDGRFVIFTSEASDLLAGHDDGISYDVFVRDRQTDSTTLVSVTTAEEPGNGDSHAVAVSSDGRYAIFSSYASNFAAGDANEGADVFRRDLQTGVTELVTVNRAGTGTADAPSSVHSWSVQVVSPDGRFVLFESAATDLVAVPAGGNRSDVYVRDLQVGTTVLVSINSVGTAAGAGDSSPAAISDDGRLVVFGSSANDLVAGDAGHQDVFVRDLATATTTMVSVDSGGVQGNYDSVMWHGGMSVDGRFVMFESRASDLAAGDTNNDVDAFLHDRQLGTTTLLSVALAGQPGNGGSYGTALAPDGRFVVLASNATDLVAGNVDGHNVFVRDVQGATTVLVSTRGPLPASASGRGGFLAERDQRRRAARAVLRPRR